MKARNQFRVETLPAIVQQSNAKAGDKPFKVLGVYIVKAGEPLAKPAP
jgi:hypothetical protein